MTFRVAGRSRLPSRGNVSGIERALSIVAGLGLTLLAARTSGALKRTAASTLGLSLLSRGATGYCGMKATVNGETTLVEGVQEQWQRARGVLGKGAAAIDSLDALFIAELQEIYSSETQLGPLLMSLADIVEHPVVERHFRGYALELDSRWEDLGRVLGSYGVNPREHPDQAMHALISETRKMAQVCGGAVRDAALVASVQRILHYKIAGYGTIASYAKTLGHIEDAARFAEYAEREEAIDAELSDLALASLNPQASVHPQGGAYEGNSEARTH